jgi:hypothetical protein
LETEDKMLTFVGGGSLDLDVLDCVKMYFGSLALDVFIYVKMYFGRLALDVFSYVNMCFGRLFHTFGETCCFLQ